MSSTSPNPSAPHRSVGRSRWRFPVMAGLGTLTVVVVGLGLVLRAGGQANKIAVASLPKGVTVVQAEAATYRPFRRYVGTVHPWIETKVGPQLISGYVDTVLVRPGDVVKRGQVIATLDCRNASASSKAVSMQARAIQAQQEALAHQASRVAEMEKGGFASANEIENRTAESASKAAEFMETQAKMQRASLEVSDCVMRAPFAAEVATRSVDPGAFVRPGTPVATLIDRSTVRVVGEVPEADFGVVAPGVQVSVRPLAGGQEVKATVSRRSPAADMSTRTVHMEIDVPDPARSLPVGTTAELNIDVGEPKVATVLPLIATSLRGDKATVFVEHQGVARKGTYRVLGERGGKIFLSPELAAGSHVVTEGRALLRDGDRVQAKLEIPEAEKPPLQVAGSRP